MFKINNMFDTFKMFRISTICLNNVHNLKLFKTRQHVRQLQHAPIAQNIQHVQNVQHGKQINMSKLFEMFNIVRIVQTGSKEFKRIQNL